MVNSKVVCNKLIIIIIMILILIISNSMAKNDRHLVIKDKELLTSNEEILTMKVNPLNQDIKDKLSISKIRKYKKLIIVYDKLTMKQLSDKLNRLMISSLAGKGELFASYSIKMGVDPYIALAIVFQETGCYYGYCSYIVRNCNNIGGMKSFDRNRCPGTSYSDFSSIDEGIIRYINNLAYGYFSRGLNTPELMNKKYAEDHEWANKVNNYINIIKEA